MAWMDETGDLWRSDRNLFLFDYVYNPGEHTVTIYGLTENYRVNEEAYFDILFQKNLYNW